MTFFREENRHGIPGRAVPDSPRYPLAGLLCPGQYCATGACHRIAACAPWRGCIVQRTWENARDLAPGMKLSFINPAHARAHGSLFHVPSPLPVTFRLRCVFSSRRDAGGERTHSWTETIPNKTLHETTSFRGTPLHFPAGRHGPEDEYILPDHRPKQELQDSARERRPAVFSHQPGWFLPPGRSRSPLPSQSPDPPDLPDPATDPRVRPPKLQFLRKNLQKVFIQ